MSTTTLTNLYDPQFSTLFEQAPFYAKKGTIRATQATQAALDAGEYDRMGARYDPSSGQTIMDTFVMVTTENGVRRPKLENSRPILNGDWVAINPKELPDDRENIYPISNESFQKRYEPTNTPGVYRPKATLARIIKNPTGLPVEVNSPWGGTQSGDANCYFCAQFFTDENGNLIERPKYRYVLSAGDFKKYGLADEVLGENWRSQYPNLR